MSARPVDFRDVSLRGLRMNPASQQPPPTCCLFFSHAGVRIFFQHGEMKWNAAHRICSPPPPQWPEFDSYIRQIPKITDSSQGDGEDEHGGGGGQQNPYWAANEFSVCWLVIRVFEALLLVNIKMKANIAGGEIGSSCGIRIRSGEKVWKCHRSLEES